MLDQSFSKSNFIKLIKNNADIGSNNLGNDNEMISFNFTTLADKISKGTFTFLPFQKFKVNKKNFYRTNEYRNEFVLRKISDNLRRLYKISQADRGKIIKQTKTLLLEDTPKFIIRLDIENFYESINKKSLYQMIFDDPLPSSQTKILLKKILLEGYFEHKKGLPRGLSISAILSEYYLREFDSFVNRLEGVYYYARYVDDIVIFSYKLAPSIKTDITKFLLDKKGLKLNLIKSQDILSVCCNCYNECSCNQGCKCRLKCKCKPISTQYNALDYLGYKFIFSKVPDSKFSLKITLAEKKIKKIKSRIVNSFIDFNKDYNIDLLINRIKFLTGNYSISKGNTGNLNSGIYYNYPIINFYDDLILLNNFLNVLIYSNKGYVGSALKANLTNAQRKELKIYSFTFGHESKIIYNFTRSEIREIKRVW